MFNKSLNVDSVAFDPFAAKGKHIPHLAGRRAVFSFSQNSWCLSGLDLRGVNRSFDRRGIG